MTVPPASNPPVTGQPAASSLDPPETVEAESEVVSCDGGGALGHPRVWLNMEGKGFIDCPYCDRRFVLKAGAAGSAGH